jgi:hypothetical protein
VLDAEIDLVIALQHAGNLAQFQGKASRSYNPASCGVRNASGRRQSASEGAWAST